MIYRLEVNSVSAHSQAKLLFNKGLFSLAVEKGVSMPLNDSHVVQRIRSIAKLHPELVSYVLLHPLR